MPQEPGFTGPARGVKVPIGEVSVMPQPSVSRQPMSFLEAAAARRPASGAPPEAHNLSDDKSIVSTPGRLRIATCIVGTPAKTVIFLTTMSFAAAAGSKRGCRTSSAPSRKPSMQDRPRAHRYGRAAGRREYAPCPPPARPSRCASSSPCSARRRRSDWRGSASRPWASRWCRRYIGSPPARP